MLKWPRLGRGVKVRHAQLIRQPFESNSFVDRSRMTGFIQTNDVGILSLQNVGEHGKIGVVPPGEPAMHVPRKYSHGLLSFTSVGDHHEG